MVKSTVDNFISVLLLLGGFYSCTPISVQSFGFQDAIAKTNIFSKISLDEFGAVGDGVADDTQALLMAWKQACMTNMGPASLIIPFNSYYVIKPIYGGLLAPEDPSAWKGFSTNYWLLFHGVNDLTVDGGGFIDGRGHNWWTTSCKVDKTRPCRRAPTAIAFDSITKVVVRNLVVRNAPQMHIMFSKCNGVEAQYIQVFAPESSPNTDGIHITASTHVAIEYANIGTGDDCISIGKDSYDIVIQNIACGPGHGISIGGLGKGHSLARVAMIQVTNVFIHDTTNGLRIKTWQGGTGFVQGITYQNVRTQNVSYPIIIDQYYCDKRKPCTNQTSAVKVSEVRYIGIVGTSSTQEAVRFACSQTVPCENIVLENIELRLDSGGYATSYCLNAKGYNFGRVSPPSCLQTYSQTGYSSLNVLQKKIHAKITRKNNE